MDDIAGAAHQHLPAGKPAVVDVGPQMVVDPGQPGSIETDACRVHQGEGSLQRVHRIFLSEMLPETKVTPAGRLSGSGSCLAALTSSLARTHRGRRQQ